MNRRLFALILITLVPSTPAHATTRQVPGSYPTIQAAVDAAAAGDTIAVAPGTYVEHVLIATVGVVVKSTNGAAVTIVDGGGTGRCFTITAWGTRLHDLTITHGHAIGGSGGGVFVSYFNYSGIEISNNIIIDNEADADGGGMYAGGEVVIVGNRFESNRAVRGGGAFLTTLPFLGSFVSQCTFYANSASTLGGALHVDPYGLVEVATIDHNTAGQQGGGVFYDEGGGYSPTIAQCVLSFNSAPVGGGIEGTGASGSSSGAVSCNDVFRNTGGDYGPVMGDLTGAFNNISADPLYCNPPANYMLHSDSPAYFANHAGCGTMGAFGVGCEPTDVDPGSRPIARTAPSAYHLSVRPSVTSADVSVRFSLPTAGLVCAEVLDARGHRIRVLAGQVFTVDAHTLRWNLTDDAGRRVDAGMYVIRLSAGTRSETEKIFVLH